MLEEQSIFFINKCRSYINFMLTQQWSGIEKQDIDRWIDNFSGFTVQEKMFAYKLLINLIYYSEKDIIGTLKDAIYNKIFYKTILERQVEADFNLSPKALLNLVKEELSETCFVPLLDSGKPHESANYVSRLLVQQGIISPYQSLFVTNIEEAMKEYKFTRLIVIDDCVGSGDQLRAFWNTCKLKQKNGNVVLLKNYCKENDIEPNYLTLFGYKPSIQQLRKEFLELNIFCIRELEDAQRVFQNNSYVWRDEKELNEAINFFEKVTCERGIALWGYRNLDFAFIMHQTIPDWSLPLFWQENPDWNLLMRRKNSNA